MTAARIAVLAALWFSSQLCVLPAVSARSTTVSLVKVSNKHIPSLTDPGDAQSLRRSIRSSLDYYHALPSQTMIQFGADSYSVSHLIKSLEAVDGFLEAHAPAELAEFLKKQFWVYQSVGVNAKREITFSSYHEASIRASLKPNGKYRFPIYGRPPDLVDVQLEPFGAQWKGQRVAGRLDGRNVIPYHTREEIENGKALAGRNLEIAWADSQTEILFLQIQGSGWILTPEGEEYHIRYAGDNGRPYGSVGTYILAQGLMPREKFGHDAMRDFLDGLDDPKRQSILNQNPRFIFFEITSATTQTRGSLMVPLTADRSVAVDPQHYPQGALAWVQTEAPSLDAGGKVSGKAILERFVLCQDEGGAIKGAGRVDYFSGRGPRAETFAQHLWNKGRMYFFVMKRDSEK